MDYSAPSASYTAPAGGDSYGDYGGGGTDYGGMDDYGDYSAPAPAPIQSTRNRPMNTTASTGARKYYDDNEDDEISYAPGPSRKRFAASKKPISKQRRRDDDNEDDNVRYSYGGRRYILEDADDDEDDGLVHPRIVKKAVSKAKVASKVNNRKTIIVAKKRATFATGTKRTDGLNRVTSKSRRANAAGSEPDDDPGLNIGAEVDLSSMFFWKTDFLLNLLLKNFFFSTRFIIIFFFLIYRLFQNTS
jgi:hypothetical protein